MQISRYTIHYVVVALALAIGLTALILPKKAGAQTSSDSAGYYTTTSSSTSTSSTDATTGVTTTTTDTTTTVPRGLYSTRESDRTSDIEARYPYDSTNGTNRSDVDAVRSGFDDPRNPWDGRYTNDNPANHSNSLGANETVNTMRGSEDNSRYRPGRYGTYSVHRH